MHVLLGGGMGLIERESGRVVRQAHKVRGLFPFLKNEMEDGVA